MSSGPVHTGTELCQKKKRCVTIIIPKEERCSYEKECEIWRNTTGELCVHCIYHKRVDIPEIIKFRKKQIGIKEDQ